MRVVLIGLLLLNGLGIAEPAELALPEPDVRLKIAGDITPSPDGNLAVVNNEHDVYICNIRDQRQSTKKVLSLPGQHWRAHDFTFSSDGRTVVALAFEGRDCYRESLLAWDIQGIEKPRVIVIPEDGPFMAPIRFSVDSNHQLVIGGRNRVHLFNLDSGVARSFDAYGPRARYAWDVAANSTSLYYLERYYDIGAHKVSMSGQDMRVRGVDSNAMKEIRRRIDPNNATGSVSVLCMSMDLSSDSSEVVLAISGSNDVRIIVRLDANDMTLRSCVGVPAGFEVTTVRYVGVSKVFWVGGEVNSCSKWGFIQKDDHEWQWWMDSSSPIEHCVVDYTSGGYVVASDAAGNLSCWNRAKWPTEWKAIQW